MPDQNNNLTWFQVNTDWSKGKVEMIAATRARTINFPKPKVILVIGRIIANKSIEVASSSLTDRVLAQPTSDKGTARPPARGATPGCCRCKSPASAAVTAPRTATSLSV